MQDTNFDDLAEYFKARIYGSHKGKIRLAVVWRDLLDCVPRLESGGLRVLDMGAGFAQTSLKLAALGHQVCINDVSSKMLDVAQTHAKRMGVEANIQWRHGAFQDLPSEPYDLVLCHAVLEWLHEPAAWFEALSRFIHRGSVVSLMFYNRDALVLHNLIRGNFNKVKRGNFSGMKGGLTPPNPLALSWVWSQLEQAGLEVRRASGVRVFSDFAGNKRGGLESPDAVLEMELAHASKEPFWRLGRYIHAVCQKPS